MGSRHPRDSSASDAVDCQANATRKRGHVNITHARMTAARNALRARRRTSPVSNGVGEQYPERCRHGAFDAAVRGRIGRHFPNSARSCSISERACSSVSVLRRANASAATTFA